MAYRHINSFSHQYGSGVYPEGYNAALGILPASPSPENRLEVILPRESGTAIDITSLSDQLGDTVNAEDRLLVYDAIRRRAQSVVEFGFLIQHSDEIEDVIRRNQMISQTRPTPRGAEGSAMPSRLVKSPQRSINSSQDVNVVESNRNYTTYVT